MDPFIFGSRELEDELREDAHMAGEVDWLQSIARPGMVALDVGANRGVTTVALARSVGPQGRVYGFEPVPAYCRVARENLVRNQAANCEVFELALGDRRQRLAFHERGGSSGIVPGENGALLMVEATTIADFVHQHGIGHVDVLSMDCEGSELRVLRGYGGLLREHAPLIFCEIHHDYLASLGHDAGELVALLEDVGYQVEPVEVESPGEETTMEACSHIVARPSGPTPRY